MSYPATRTTLLNLLINHLKLEIRHRYYYTLLLKLVGLLFHQLKFSVWPSGQNRRKSSLQCHIIKDTLLQSTFSAILPTGKELNLKHKISFRYFITSPSHSLLIRFIIIE